MLKQTDIATLLRKLEVRGINAVVHTDMAALGEVEGGARTVCQALIEAFGPEGTIVMPAFTGNKTVFGGAFDPIPYQIDLPVVQELGSVAETFRLLPGVHRSNHPTHSFAACGARAAQMLSTQRDNNTLGPIKKLNVSQGYILLLGVGLNSVTAIHLAEEMATVPYLGRCIACRTNAAGFSERVVVEQLPGCSATFDRIEARIDPEEVTQVELPNGMARKIAVRYLVRLASAALQKDPALLICEQPDCAGCAVKRAALAPGG